MSTILQIKDLSKNYGSIKALNKLNVEVKSGMVFGILGPNGSGKTTTLGILLGVLNPTSGTYSWFDNGTTDSNRKRIGALLETPNFFPYLTAVQNLRIVAKIKDLEFNAIDKEALEDRIEKVLEVVNLYERKDTKFKTYSLGMKQRLAIASALLSDPEVLVLDEPTNGLDPQGIAEIRKLITDIAKEGKTILLASHQLDEVEKVCTDVVILKKGIAVTQSDVDTITSGTKQVYVAAADLSAIQNLVKKFEGVSVASEDNGGLLLNIDENLDTISINKFFFDNNIILSELREVKKSLESSFLEITKE